MGCAYTTINYECALEALPSSKFCIAHDKRDDKGGNINEFKRHIEEKLRKSDFCFIGYVFPGGFSFYQQTFDKEVRFIGAKFSGQIDFIGAKFLEKAYFNGAEFSGLTSFFLAEFSGEEIFFQGAKFFGETSFECAQFKAKKKTNFKNTRFLGEIDFAGSVFSSDETHFEDALFLGSTNFGDVKFEKKVFLYNTQFSGIRNLKLGQLEQIGEEQQVDYNKAKEIYMSLRNYFRSAGRYEDEHEASKIEGDIQRKWYWQHRKKSRWVGSMLINLLCGYGERPWRVVVCSIVIIFLFACFYFAVTLYHRTWYPGIVSGIQGGHQDSLLLDWKRIKEHPFESGGNLIYFSVVTFTTLGYGDFHPIGLAKGFAMTEAFIGAGMMALFLVTFVRRVMR